MRKKPTSLKARTRAPSKTLEKELIAKAKRFLKNPESVLPVCMKKCVLCPFSSSKKHIMKVVKYKDNEKKLKSLSESGDEIGKAFASLALILLKKRVPYIATLRSPFGDIPFVVRGTAKKEKLAAIQNFENPIYRLFLILDLVKKKKLRFYSIKDKIICMGKWDDVPEEYVEFVMEKLHLTKVNGIYVCNEKHIPHIGSVRNSKEHFVINWKNANIRIAICRRCCKKIKNVVGSIVKYMAVPKAKEQFEVSVYIALKCMKECDECIVEDMKISEATKESYLSGKLTDEELLHRGLDDIRKRVLRSSNAIYIMDNSCYSYEKKLFIKDIDGNEDEKECVSIILNKMKKSVILEGKTTEKFLEIYWEDYKEKVLNEICEDEEIIKNLKDKKDTPSRIIRLALSEKKIKEIISKLPKYKKMSAVARFADRAARTCIAYGEEALLKFIEQEISDDTRIRTLAYAFLSAVGRSDGRDWRYTTEEKDFGEYLKSAVKELVNSTPEKYHENLQKLIKATGSTEELIKE